MATDSSTIDKSVLLRQWFWPLRKAFWTAVIGLMVWLLGSGAQALWASHRAEDPVAYQLQHLEVELQALGDLSPVWVQPAAVARWIGDTLHTVALSTATVVARALMNIPGPTRELAASDYIRLHPDPGGAFAAQVIQTHSDWKLAVLATYGFAVRTAMYVAMLPLLVLAVLVGLSDGWVARAVRKANAGRESASVYHRAKLGVTFTVISGYLLCLSLPDLSHPGQALLFICLVVGVLARLQVKFYKKYL